MLIILLLISNVVYTHDHHDHDHHHHDHENEHNDEISDELVWVYGLSSGVMLGLLGLIVSAFFVLLHKYLHKYFQSII